MKALIKVGYACNENCTFCHTADIRHLDDTSERVDWKIDRAKRLGASMVVLSGGEPTMRPELSRWARRIAAHGLDFGLVTNGLMLSYRNVVDELVGECRLRYVYMSLHGGEPKVHGSVVRADTFHKAMQAIENLHGRIPDLTINCVITTANLKHLKGLVDRLLPFEDLCIKFSMTQPKGAANRAFDVIVPEVAACAARVNEAIAYGLSRRTERGPRFAHDGLPFCLLPGYEHLYDDLKTHRYATMIESDEDDFVPVDDVAKIQPEEVCGDCALRGACPGLYRGYHEIHGASALRPVTDRPRANSYNFVPERDLARPPGAPCPIRADGTSPYDRGRTLLLRLKDRMRLFRTETRDFSDEELFATKESAGQLYLDVSTKLAPDDFAKDLRKLRPAAECEACPERPRCTGAWEPVPADVFTRDDRDVMEILANLSGRVLDLGCGEGPYLEALARRAAEGHITYVGVDPDPQRLAVLASRHPFAQFVEGRAEELDEALGTFDHVLALRSVNHLEDPARAFGAAIARLRPGGTLTLVDNVAFGLVRSRAHATRAENAPGNRFEHFRNDDAARTARRLEDKPLRLLECRDVGRETSNQWMLRYERTGEMPS
ncbi:radical SAM protein [Polyangium mundeleinium]|uniref:Radical SAM protein n=1 Tax=Polyangium mundeleinium TaxID=2995306 RepID=A0ABT5ER52_9BACT|nr:radical SAM protein [Polyangium mundeleinium]MDC0743673.1 radical SAM protein [Polyangium mundeleinium]